MSNSENAGAGMSSELQAIMQRRLAKINLQNENEESATNGNDTITENENENENDNANPNPNDKNEVAHCADASQKGGKKKEVPAKTIVREPSAYGQHNIDKAAKGVADDEMTEFERRKAMFNKNKPVKKSNKTRESKATRISSPLAVDEKLAKKKTKSDPEVTSFIPYSLRPVSAKKPATGSIKSPSNNTDSSGKKVPKVVITRQPPPPPTSPPPNFSPSRSPTKVVKQSPPINISPKKYALPSSHVQAMKMKFLFKNPKPSMSQEDVQNSPRGSKEDEMTTFDPSTGADTVVPTVDVSMDARTESSDYNEELIIESPANKSIGDVKQESAKVQYDDAMGIEHPEIEETAQTGKNTEPLTESMFADFGEENSVVSKSPFREKFNAKSGTYAIQETNTNLDSMFRTSNNMSEPTTTEEGGGGQQELFAEWDDIAQSELANPTNEIENNATSDHVADWNWNNDPFSNNNMVVPGSNIAEVNAAKSEEERSYKANYESGENDAYVPPPAFGFGSDATFEPEEEDFEDDSDEETLLDGDLDAKVAQEVVLKSFSLPLVSSPLREGSSYCSQNPLNENVIMCRKLGKKWYIDEVDLAGEGDITRSVEISCIDMKSALDASLQIIPCGIQDVLGMTAGLHYEHGHSRVRVAVIMRLFAFGANGSVSVVAIWQWGYGIKRSISLHRVIRAPSCKGLGDYDPSGACISNGLLLVPGQVNLRPALLICKPHLESVWVPSFLDSGSGKIETVSKICCMKICAHSKLVAAAMDDCSLGVWSFADYTISNSKIPIAKQQMKLICVLEGASSLEKVSGRLFVDDDGEDDVKRNIEDSVDNFGKESDGRCQCLSWMPTKNSVVSCYLLAASFLTGVVVYAIPSNHSATSHDAQSISDISNTSEQDKNHSTSSEVVHLSPIVGAVVEERFEVGVPMNSFVQWICCGGSALPHLSTGLLGTTQMDIEVSELKIPNYNHLIRQDEVYLESITKATFSKKVDKRFELWCGVKDTLVAHSNGSLTTFKLSSRFTSELHPKLFSDSMCVSSDALCLTSAGYPISSFHNVLHVHTSVNYDQSTNRSKSQGLVNGIPVIRHWLCITEIGDNKIPIKGPGAIGVDDTEDFPKGGATSSLICDLSCYDSSSMTLIPRRIARDESGNHCIILFAPTKSSGSSVTSCDVVAFAALNLLSIGGGRIPFVLHEARDASFIPSLDGEQNVLVLEKNSRTLRICSLTSLDDDLQAINRAITIFKEGSANYHKLTVDRFFVLSRQIVFLCSRKLDGKRCLFTGGSIDALIHNSGEKALVRKKTSKVWLENTEEFLSCKELSSHIHEKTPTIAVATTSRVMIISCSLQMQILSETHATIASNNLCSLGSSVVFVETGIGGTTNLCYLSPYDSNHKGKICTIAENETLKSWLLLALRPDRAVFLPVQLNSIETLPSNDKCNISCSAPVTKPLLLLEPLVCNALGHVDETQSKKLLHQVIERFGPKLTSNPHSDNEGIGTLGAGVTSRVCSILGKQLRAHMNQNEEDKILTPWVPDIMQFTTEEKSLSRSMDKKLSETSLRRNYLLEITRNKFSKMSSDNMTLRSEDFDETKHVWYRGAFENNEELLLLDSIGEWAGKYRPTIIGKIGAEVAAEAGERTLQNILAAAAKGDDTDDSGSHSEEETSSGSGGVQWSQNIGEGRNDEDNLSLYLRFSEGAEGQAWKESGLYDLSKHNNKIEMQNVDMLDLDSTTSNVDEGEPSKVRALCDLVFKRDIAFDENCGMMVEVPRGGALDVGMLHSSKNSSRQRATLEFWCFIPSISNEIVLARRSFYELVEGRRDAWCNSSKDSMLWELVALPSRRLQFRTNHGSILTSNNPQEQSSTYNLNPHEEKTDGGLLSLPGNDGFGGWNHISLTFSCRNLKSTQCNVSLRMKGSLVASSDVILKLPNLNDEESSDFSSIDRAMDRTVLMFGLRAVEGLRYTEIRFWACKRASEDINMMMYEYLDIAKMKKKFSIAIRGKGSSKVSKGSLLIAPPVIEKPKLSSERLLLQLPGIARRSKTDDVSQNDTFNSFADFASIGSTDSKSVASEEDDDDEANNDPYIQEFMTRPETSLEKNGGHDNNTISEAPSDEMGSDSTRIDASLTIRHSPLLSEQVRKSAAAAIVRGPPATRHFNGNRGGLQLSDNASKSVGNICITGSEKTIIFSPDESIPAKTYPIGASGAIISDIIDGKEYLCCFLAKDKRIVVFDLKSKIVVVELQMTTKLNYWRFLPPSSHGDTVVFLLITPIGGFHWMPLEESPRPKQIWRRGRDLQGKKIISYEEGGSNGRVHAEIRSTIALVLTSTMNEPGDSIEAWCLSVSGGMRPYCISTDVLGAALLQQDGSESVASEPYVVTISSDKNGSENAVLKLHRVSINEDLESIVVDDVVTQTEIVYEPEKTIIIPTMAMGTAPSVICLCYRDIIVVVLRDQGYIVSFQLVHEKLVFMNEAKVGCYVIDAGIEAEKESSGVDIICLLCDKDNIKDGHIARISICKC